MRVLIACDSFKDALPAKDVCHAIALGLARHSGLKIVELPLSDGGEGVLDILRHPMSLTFAYLEVTGPLFRPLTAAYGLSPDGATAVVEMARASGLERLSVAERNPLITTSFGTGQLLADAKARGARHVLLGLGGSATCDAGVGAATALGWQFLDARGRPVRPGGGALADIARMVPPGAGPCDRLDVLCDVTNPLLGAKGAAFAFGRQKGGDDEGLARLEAGLAHLASLVERQLGGRGLADAPGAGAAGGFGFGAMAFLGARLRGGTDMVLDLAGFEEAARKADLIITGEGRLDSQTSGGKLIQGICSRAGKVPVIALCGELAMTREEIRAMSLRAAYCINPSARPLPEMLAATARNLEMAAATLDLAGAGLQA